MTDGGILGRHPRVANIGVDVFADEMEGQGVEVTRVDWRPPAEGSETALALLSRAAPQVAAGNDEVIARLQGSRPLLVGVGTAGDVIPGMDHSTLLHAGPPIEWVDMSGPVRGAVIGAAIHEGLAATPQEAERLAASGAFRFSPTHEHCAVGPMAGIVSASMPVWIVENDPRGNRAYCTMNEGLGKVLRYGAFDREVLDRLAWIRKVLAPLMQDAIAGLGEPLDLRSLIAQALQMGDEGHNRNRAGTSLFLRELFPSLLALDAPSADKIAAVRFVSDNDHFFLNLTMPAAKATADAAAGIRESSIVVTMTRNGTEFGVRLAGTGDRWFTGPAGIVEGLFLPGFGPEDANPDLGDSVITETVGLGGLAMASAPAIVNFVGGSAADAVDATTSMYGITWSESAHYRIPALDFRGTPLGIDCREVVHTGVLPVINTGIAHRDPGIGQVGAGVVRPPMRAFVEALSALAEAAVP
ncbi:MAG TPA: DUF1116 domain-containing protein [Actinomycetota bacterium]